MTDTSARGGYFLPISWFGLFTLGLWMVDSASPGSLYLLGAWPVDECCQRRVLQLRHPHHHGLRRHPPALPRSTNAGGLRGNHGSAVHVGADRSAGRDVFDGNADSGGKRSGSILIQLRRLSAAVRSSACYLLLPPPPPAGGAGGNGRAGKFETCGGPPPIAPGGRAAGGPTYTGPPPYQPASQALP